MSVSTAEIFRLVLMPEQPECHTPNKEIIIENLRLIGFIGKPLSDGPDSYLVGERFFDLISFLGCSPSIKTEPQSGEDHNFCHIRILEGQESQFYSGIMTKTPSCPECKIPLKDLKEALVQGKNFSAGDKWQCQACHNTFSVSSLNWRKSAGFASFAIEIWSIYPNEAVPTDFLLGTLRSISEVNWKYIYV